MLSRYLLFMLACLSIFVIGCSSTTEPPTGGGNTPTTTLHPGPCSISEDFGIDGVIDNTLLLTYNPQGNVLTKTETYPNSPDGSVFTYTYDSTGTQLERMVWDFVEAFFVDQRFQYHYDSQGRLIREVRSRNDDGIPHSETTYTYEGTSSQPATMSVFNDLDDDIWDVQTTYTYRSDGQLAHASSVTDSNVTMLEATYTYNTADQLVTSVVDSFLGLFTIEYTYNGSGFVMTEDLTTSGGLVGDTNVITDITYDSGGNRLLDVVRGDDGWQTIYEYGCF